MLHKNIEPSKLILTIFFSTFLVSCIKNDADFKLLKVERGSGLGRFVAYVRDVSSIVDNPHNYILCLPDGRSSDDFLGVKGGYRAESISVKPVMENEGNIFSIAFQQLCYSGNESLPIMKEDFIRLLPQGKNVECRLIKRSYVSSPEVLGSFHVARADLLRFFDR